MGNVCHTRRCPEIVIPSGELAGSAVCCCGVCSVCVCVSVEAGSLCVPTSLKLPIVCRRSVFPGGANINQTR